MNVETGDQPENLEEVTRPLVVRIPAINWSFGTEPPSRNAEHPVLKVKRSYQRPAVERPVTVAAVTQAVGPE